MSGTRAI